MPRFTTAQAVHVPGHGLVQPGGTVDLKQSPAVRFLVDAGCLTPAANDKPTPTPTSPPAGEENN